MENYINNINNDNIILIKNDIEQNIIKSINNLIIKYNILNDYDYFIWLLEDKIYDINIFENINDDNNYDIIFISNIINIYIINKRLIKYIYNIDDILLKIYLLYIIDEKINIKI